MNSRKSPGKQKRIWSFNKYLFLLYFLLLIFIIIGLFAFIQENYPSHLIKEIREIKILSISDSVKAFISLLSLYIVLEGIELNFRPFFTYSSKANNNKNVNYIIWTVELTNKGKGSGIIHKINYHFKEINSTNKITDYTEIVERLSQIETTKKLHLSNISKGFALGSNENLVIFKIPISKLKMLEYFDIHLYYKSFSGQLYSKKVYILPINKITHNILHKQ